MDARQYLDETAERMMEIELNLTGRDEKHRDKVANLIHAAKEIGWITREEGIEWKKQLLSLEREA